LEIIQLPNNIFWKPSSRCGPAKIQISRINTVALCNDFLGQPDSALFYFNYAMDVAVKKKDETWVGILSGNIADIYYKRGEFDKAAALLEESIRLCF
jgi:tetratricopeptide (TPR) repeat protein